MIDTALNAHDPDAPCAAGCRFGVLPEKRAQNRMLHPKCGKCGQPLFTAHPIELTAANFDVHAARNDIPLVVDFWAPWCGPCKMMAPAYDQAAALLEPHYRLAKVNSDAEQALAARYSIRSIPTLALFKGGREAGAPTRCDGTHDIVRWARAHASAG